MLLAINIGNTNIHTGLFRGSRLVRKYSFPTAAPGVFAHLKEALSGNSADDAIICSVVPEATRKARAAAILLLGKKPLVVASSVSVPLINRYRNPRSLGQDRLVNAYAASCLYGFPSIVIDLGTAITFDVVSRQGHYLGGLILPGLRTCLDALSHSTALIPKVGLAKPGACIARDTRHGLQSGLVYGGACMIDGLVRKIKKQVGVHARCIITGGDSAFMRRYTKERMVLDRDLTLKGLRLIYNSRSKLIRS